ncbi:MAG: GTPase HflX [Peptococcaceae bacterium]|nr:GTPase HflX [Peptococcaceae bacterium]
MSEVKPIHIVEKTPEENAVIFVAASSHSKEVDGLLDELVALAETAGVTVIGRLTQLRHKPDPATYLGQGKVVELRNLCTELGCNVAICDDELSPSQLRNLEKILEIKVVDRTHLILDIFAQRAKTAEGKLQVEAAMLAYNLPRLRGKGVEMSNLGASSGGLRTRGPGETKLEYDRRRIKARMADLRQEIDDLAKHRRLQRKDRVTRGVPTVALVGYTNAGKSSLLNALTEGGAVAESKLFATLDPTARELLLPNNSKVMLVDTVGFVRKLPHQLVTAFRATLEEVKYADVLVHVVDVSHNEALEQIATVEAVLGELDSLDKPIILALNKVDRLDEPPIIPTRGKSIAISATSKTNLAELIAAIADCLVDQPKDYTFLIPFHRGELLTLLHEQGDVKMVAYTEAGTEVVVHILARYGEKIRRELDKS